VRAELGPDPKWLLPVIRQQLANGGEIKRLAAVVASWARYAEGTDERGQPIEVVDKLAGTLTRLARRWREDPAAFFANRDVFGDLADDKRFAAALPVRAGLAAPARRTGDAGVTGLTASASPKRGRAAAVRDRNGLAAAGQRATQPPAPMKAGSASPHDRRRCVRLRGKRTGELCCAS